MHRWLVWLGVVAACGTGLAQDLIPLDRSKIGKPPRFLGLPLSPVDGEMTDSRGKSSPVDTAAAKGRAASCAGYPSVTLEPGRSLRWTLPESAKGEFFLYFLVRTGHQHGYEYVHPEMAYTAALEGRDIKLEPVREVAAVRVYQSQDSWGHDVGWIRSKKQAVLRPGQRLAIGCSEKHAFVSQGLLISEDAHRLTQTLGRISRIEARRSEFRVLLLRVAEEFPTLKASSHAIMARFKALTDRLARLRADLDAAAGKAQAGAKTHPAPLAARARGLAEELSKAEQRGSEELCAALRTVQGLLLKRSRLLRGIAQADYYARDCAYAADVAWWYLQAARQPDTRRVGVAEAQRLATWLWRAKQFIERAEQAKARSDPAAGQDKRPEPSRADSLQPSAHGSILLNGAWEMSTSGSPSEPPKDGWWPIRVPHGPWHETVGQFMALDRRWPKGQRWAWYRVRFPVPREWRMSSVALRFDAAFHLCEAYVNGRFVGRHIGGFDPFEFELRDFVKPGETAELLCFVHDTSYTALAKSPRKDQPTGWSSGPNHYVISDAWGARFGGIWQNVTLIGRPWLSVAEVLVMPSVRRGKLATRTTIQWTGRRHEGLLRVPFLIRQDVLFKGKVVLKMRDQMVSIMPGFVEQEVTWPDAPLWGIGGEYGDPANLCFLRTRLIVPNMPVPVATRYDRFGFREFWIADGQFWLNGQRLPLQGGGTWYLQEGKIAHGHRWFVQRFVALERGMNVNIERWHRHGDVASDIFDVTDELGMLNEPEGAYWGCHGIPDILGYADFDDPVWVKNVTAHYRAWVRKHFNHPSIVLWSLENETFTRAQRPPGMLDRFLAFGDAVKAADPTRPITFHGSENGRHATKNPRIEIVNLHYPSNDRVAGWKERWGGRPCIDGEFQSYPPLFLKCNNDPKVAEENLKKLQRWIEAKWAFYRKAQLAGSFYFLPYMAALVSTARPEWMGPWGDLLPPLKTAPVKQHGWAKGQAQLSADVPITWPSLSGPGIKCERLRTGLGNRSLINWFDPKRPVATPTPVYETLRKSWRPMPPLRNAKAPEVIVTVTRGGKPLAGVAVMATPLDGQCTSPIGVMTDPAGTAWLILREPGRYRLSCGGKTVTFAARLGRLDAPPGFADVPRVALKLGEDRRQEGKAR